MILAKTPSVVYEASGFFAPNVQISESTNLFLSHCSNLTKLRFPCSMGHVKKKSDLFLLIPKNTCALGNCKKFFGTDPVNSFLCSNYFCTG